MNYSKKNPIPQKTNPSFTNTVFMEKLVVIPAFLSFLFFLILPVVLSILLLTSCQEEIIEITQEAPEDIFSVNSEVATLMKSTATNDGSKDNIVDGSSCFNVVLPVHIFVNSLEIIVDEEEDFEVIEAIFDEFEDDNDSVEFAFPIKIILADFSEIIIENQARLEEYRNTCGGDNEPDDDIECIDFHYPISFSLFNSQHNLIDTKIVENDRDMYLFINNITASDIVSITFPIEVILTDETVSNINIRGGSHHENLILWDGIKMYQSGHFFGLISAFNPYLTKKARLIKNGTEANLTGGVSGTILMFTDDIITQKLQSAVGLNLINADVLVDVPLGNYSSVQLSARKSINDLVKTPSYKQYFKKAFQNSEVVNNSTDVINTNDDFSFYDINMRWLYQLTEYDKIRVNFLAVDNNLLFTENAVVLEQEESKESSASQNNIAASVFYQRNWNNRFSTDLQLYTTKYLLKSTNSDIINQQRLIQENEVLEESVRLDTKYKLTDNLTLYNGYEYVETGISNVQDVDNPLFRTKIKEVIRSHGLSSQLGYQSENRTTNIRAGLRINYLEKFGKYLLEPRWSFSQRVLNSFTFEILGELKHQTSTQIVDFQNDFLGVENRRWILTNATDIPIVKSKQASAGLHYHKRGWLVSAEGYYKFVDGITSKSQGFQNQYKFSKTDGNYTVYGSDLLINKRAGKMSTWISYSYVDNNYNFEMLSESSFPNNIDIRHSVSLATAYTNKGFKISSGLNWHSGKPTTKPVAGNEIIDDEINYESANSSRLDDYMRIDISAQYNFNIGNKIKAQFGLSIWNLLNEKNPTNRYYRIVNNEVDQVEQFSLQSTPNASLRVIF